MPIKIIKNQEHIFVLVIRMHAALVTTNKKVTQI